MQYPQPKYNGDPTIASLANGLGTLGRYGDSYMVHAAEGETVIPAEILDANPELKNQLFWQMRMMGIEDPNRYVVGNNLNSINPITGQPEFFFKKIFKAVKKVFKKALPVIAPIIGNMILPGIGGPIASALVTKLQGGSWGDALKGAALSYGMSALGSGISGGIGGLGPSGGGFGSGFAQGLGEGIMAPFQAAGNLFAGTGAPFLGGANPATMNPLAQGIFGPTGLGMAFPQGAAALKQVPPQIAFGSQTLGKILPSYQTGEQLGQFGINPQTGQYQPKQMLGIPSARPGGAEYIQVAGEGPAVHAQDPTSGQLVRLNSSEAAQLRASGKLATGGSGENILTSDWQAALTAQAPGTSLTSATGVPPTGSLGEVKKFGNDYYKWGPRGDKYGWIATDAPTPSLFSPEGAKQFAGQAAKTLAIPAALGIAAYVMSPEEEDVAAQVQGLAANDPKRIAYEQWRTLQDKTSPDARQLYNTWYGAPAISTPQQLATIAGIKLEEAEKQPQFAHNIQPTTAAQGGIMRLQGGGEITGPGTGTSDSIPARLSDGEFVMTADAVQGMGNGNRDLGAARMYDLMSRYERTV